MLEIIQVAYSIVISREKAIVFAKSMLRNAQRQSVVAAEEKCLFVMIVDKRHADINSLLISEELLMVSPAVHFFNRTARNRTASSKFETAPQSAIFAAKLRGKPQTSDK